jgi:hypothetical protein
MLSSHEVACRSMRLNGEALLAMPASLDTPYELLGTLAEVLRYGKTSMCSTHLTHLEPYWWRTTSLKG